MDHEHPASTMSFWKSPVGAIYTLVAIAAGAYLWVTHKDHVFALLPYAFLAACPLMHILMHRGGHGHHAGKADERVPRDG
jgi:hypothetical protein